MTGYLHPELPPIAITRGDSEKLARLTNAGGQFRQAADMLAREVERAQLIDDVEIRPGLVKMGSRVTFRDDISGQERTVTLVYPQEADVTEGKISVLTPVGAALIGLSVSQSIAWQTPGGDLRSLTVMKVET
jgi:regulator of nucleoside diphosphate kinase